MEGLFTFQGGEVVFQMGDSSLSGGRGAPWGPSVLMGGFSKKIVGCGGVASMPPLVFLIKINLLLIDPEMLTSGSSKAKLFTKDFT